MNDSQERKKKTSDDPYVRQLQLKDKAEERFIKDRQNRRSLMLKRQLQKDSYKAKRKLLKDNRSAKRESSILSFFKFDTVSSIVKFVIMFVVFLWIFPKIKRFFQQIKTYGTIDESKLKYDKLKHDDIANKYYLALNTGSLSQTDSKMIISLNNSLMNWGIDDKLAVIEAFGVRTFDLVLDIFSDKSFDLPTAFKELVINSTLENKEEKETTIKVWGSWIR